MRLHPCPSRAISTAHSLKQALTRPSICFSTLRVSHRGFALAPALCRKQARGLSLLATVTTMMREILHTVSLAAPPLTRPATAAREREDLAYLCSHTSSAPRHLFSRAAAATAPHIHRLAHFGYTITSDQHGIITRRQQEHAHRQSVSLPRARKKELTDMSVVTASSISSCSLRAVPSAVETPRSARAAWPPSPIVEGGPGMDRDRHAKAGTRESRKLSSSSTHPTHPLLIKPGLRRGVRRLGCAAGIRDSTQQRKVRKTKIREMTSSKRQG